MEEKQPNRPFSADVYTTLDAYQAGFLTLRKHTPKLIGQGNKIVFAFDTNDALYKDLADYNAGAMVEALKLAVAVKSLKSQIYSMRRNKEDDFAGNFK